MKTMPQNIQEERYRWIRPILKGEMTIKATVRFAPFSERTLKYWLSRYREKGLEGLRIESRRPKSQPNETPIRIKERIIELRKDSKKCALKLQWDLADEGIIINERTIGKILKTEGLTRKYKVRRIKYKYVKDRILPGWLLEIDVKYVPEKLNEMQYFQYTAIDVATRWRYIAIYDAQANESTLHFLQETLKRFPYMIKAIKTDNHSTFTNRSVGYDKSSDPRHPRLHDLDLFCQKLGILHYLIDPGKPAQNGTVERSHRSDQETFYDTVTYATVEELRLKIRLWNMYYNDLRHCGLNGLTPNQALQAYGVQYVRT